MTSRAFMFEASGKHFGREASMRCKADREKESLGGAVSRAVVMAMAVHSGCQRLSGRDEGRLTWLVTNGVAWRSRVVASELDPRGR